MKCEMCGKENKSVHEGQCLNCHIEVCDMPLSECLAKQILFKKMGIIQRDAYFDSDEVNDYLEALK